jgi:hypothetical protein
METTEALEPDVFRYLAILEASLLILRRSAVRADELAVIANCMALVGEPGQYPVVDPL